MNNTTKNIVIAGGCFWGVEEYYRRLKGIIKAEAGYAQGTLDHPTYEAVCSGKTGHTEAVRLTYDPTVISYEKILEHLFRMIDPTQENRQGNDIGTQYRTGIYPDNEEEIMLARAYIQQNVEPRYTAPIKTEVKALTSFWVAEDFHQNYLVKYPMGYCHIDFSLIHPHELKETP